MKRWGTSGAACPFDDADVEPVVVEVPYLDGMGAGPALGVTDAYLSEEYDAFDNLVEFAGREGMRDSAIELVIELAQIASKPHISIQTDEEVTPLMERVVTTIVNAMHQHTVVTFLLVFAMEFEATHIEHADECRKCERPRRTSLPPLLRRARLLRQLADNFSPIESTTVVHVDDIEPRVALDLCAVLTEKVAAMYDVSPADLLDGLRSSISNRLPNQD